MAAVERLALERDDDAWRTAGQSLERAHGVGRLAFVRRGPATVLAECYQEAGLRLRLPRPEKGALVEAVVINTAGGLTGGDRFSLDVALGPGAEAIVLGQAAEKIYRSSGGVGRFQTRISIGAGARLDYVPQEAILFDGAALARSVEVDLEAGSRFLGVESVVFGRLARGERVASAFLFDAWRVRRGGRPVYADAIRFDGAVETRLDRRSSGRGARAVSSLVMVSPEAEAALDAARAALAPFEGRGVEAGVSAFDGMLTARLAACDPFALRCALTALLERLRGPLPRVWFV